MKTHIDNIISGETYNKSKETIYVVGYSIIIFIFLYKIILLDILYIQTMYFGIYNFYILITFFLVISLVVGFLTHKVIISIMSFIKFLIKTIVNLVK